MRLLTLDLIAWGPFSDRSLDLSGGREGLHLIYGPNEAGKSSALRALRALLYGVDARTKDAFLHEYKDLRVRSRLRHSDGREIDVTRRKGNKKTLLGSDEAVLLDNTLDPYVGGVGEALFARQFGMSHEDLVAGGRELLEGGGGMAEGIFAAAAGAGQLRRLLAALDREAEEIYGATARNRPLNQLLDRHKQLREQSQSLAVASKDWEEHDRKLRDAERRKAELTARLGEQRNQLSRIERLQTAMPVVARRRLLVEERAALGTVLLLPRDFGQRRRDVVTDLARERESLRETRRRIEDTRTELAALHVPAALLEKGDEISKLFQELGKLSSYDEDLPKRRAAMGSAFAAARGFLEDLRPGLPLDQAVSLRIDLARRTRIQNLMLHRPELISRIKTAEREGAKAAEELARAQKELQELGAPGEAAPLKSLLERATQYGNLPKLLAEAEAAAATASSEAEVALSALTPRPGSIGEVESLPVPSDESVLRFAGDYQACDRMDEELTRRLAEKAGRAADVEREIDNLRSQAAVPTEEDLSEARARRESGWSLVRAAWLDGIDDKDAQEAYDPQLPLDRAYEKSVARTDDVADRLRHEAERVARHAELLNEKRRLAQEIEKMRGEQVTGAASRAALEQRWKELWEPCGLEPLSPAEMRPWLRRHQDLCALLRKSRECGRKVDLLRGQAEDLRTELSQELARLGGELAREGEGLAGLLDRSKRGLAKIEALEQKLRELSQSIGTAEARIADQEREKASAASELDRWTADWRAAVQGLTRDGELAPEEANVFLSRLDQMFQKIGEGEELRHRVEGMEAEKASFARAAAELARAAAPELAPLAPETSARRMHEQLAQAREDRVKHGQLRRQLADLEKSLRAAEETALALEETLAGLCRTAQCDDPAKLEALEAASERARELDSEREGIDRQLAQIAPRGSVEALIEEAIAEDPDGLSGKRTTVENEIRLLGEAISTADQEIGTENTELARMDGRDAAAGAAEEAEGVLAQAGAAAERYIELRTAAVLLRTALEAYRSRNQGPVLLRAGQIFGELTRASFQGLRTEYDEDDKPLIVGVRPDGTTVTVDGMSDGTRDQLFLALRLAAIELHVQSAEPLPLVLDDLLVNFDDERSTATLRLLTALSSKVQVLFFTHHAHLVDLARSIDEGGSLLVHTL